MMNNTFQFVDISLLCIDLVLKLLNQYGFLYSYFGSSSIMLYILLELFNILVRLSKFVMTNFALLQLSLQIFPSLCPTFPYSQTCVWGHTCMMLFRQELHIEHIPYFTGISWAINLMSDDVIDVLGAYTYPRTGSTLYSYGRI